MSRAIRHAHSLPRMLRTSSSAWSYPCSVETQRTACSGGLSPDSMTADRSRRSSIRWTKFVSALYLPHLPRLAHPRSIADDTASLLRRPDDGVDGEYWLFNDFAAPVCKI